MGDLTLAFLLATLRDELNLPFTIDDLGSEVLLGTDGLDLESLELLDVMNHAEYEFGITLPDEDYRRLGGYTVSDFLRYLDAQIVVNGRAITPAAMRGYLTSTSEIGVPADLPNDRTFDLDSLGRAWLAHALSEDLELAVGEDEAWLRAPVSMNSLTAHVRSALRAAHER